MIVWMTHHRDALASATRRLLRAPLNTLLALFVIGIALALPAAGYLALTQLAALAQNFAGKPQISFFLAHDAGKAEIEGIRQRLNSAAVGDWRFVSRSEALQHLQAEQGMAEIVKSLPQNPLPDAFIVAPRDAAPEHLEQLAAAFASWPNVEHVQLDSAWVRRLDAFIRLGETAVLLLAAVFAVALLVITFNTIRLQVMAGAAEIEVARLVGATDGWIRRPFQYFGALQGGLGGILALGLIALAAQHIAPAIATLASLYGSNFTLQPPGITEIATVPLAGALLGWIGAQLSVGLSLRQLGR